MKKKVLVLTYEDDPHANSVCDYFEKTDINYFRVDTDKIIRDYKITFDSKSGSFIISNELRKAVIDESWNIWNRRIIKPDVPTGIPRDIEKIILNETKSTWDSLLFTHKGKIVNDPRAQYTANNKIDQILFAKSNNRQINIPLTILSNDPDKFLSFCGDNDRVCHKLQNMSCVVKDEEPLTIYTNIVKKEDLEHIHLIRNHPSLFQCYIDKEYELRITSLEEKVIGIAIHSQNSEKSKIDFRKYDFEKVKYEKVDLPNNVTSFCLELLKHYNLSFGEIDMIYTKEGEYYFLELNPNGQWLWLELLSRYNLTKDVAENLIK